MIRRICHRVGLLIALLIPLLVTVGPAAAGTPCGGQGENCCPGDSCESGLACQPSGGGSECVPCGEFGQPCCGGECDNAGLACVDGTCDDCGGPGLGCCAGEPECAEEFICSGMDCVQCGQEAGQPCCDEGSEDECREGLLCDAAICEACGDIGLQCCAGDTCPEDGTCVSGTCQGDAAPAVIGAPAISGIGLALMAIAIVTVGVFGVRRRRAAR
jgi:hypothetical protein